jgi:hypothetical protein
MIAAAEDFGTKPIRGAILRNDCQMGPQDGILPYMLESM